MLHAGRFKALFCAGFAQDTQLRGEGKIGEVVLSLGQFLDDLVDTDSPHSGRPAVFLGTGYLTGMAAGAVLIVKLRVSNVYRKTPYLVLHL